MATLMGFGFNYIMGWLPNYRLRQAVRDVHSNLQLTRMEAIKRHVECAVSFTKTGAVINGYEIYTDLDGDYQRDAGEDVLKTVALTDYQGDVSFDAGAANGGVTFANNSLGQPTVSFRTNGIPEQGDGSTLSNETVNLINTQNKTQVVEVNQVGRIQIQ